jgi:ferredoxin
MKVEVDLGLCEHQGVCIGIAPDVFEFDDDGGLVVLQPEPPESARVLLEDAEAACPLAAITISG